MMARLIMRGLLVPISLLAASLVGCGDTDDEESASSSSTQGVAEVQEGLQLRPSAPTTGKQESTSSESDGSFRGLHERTGSSNPGTPGDERSEPVPVPWDTPRVKVANDA